MSENSYEYELPGAEDGVNASVLITCGKPSATGTMNVSMTYEGEPALVCYLLQTAKDSIEASMESSNDRESC